MGVFVTSTLGVGGERFPQEFTPLKSGNIPQGTTVREEIVKETELAWLAGIVDGEGSICFTQSFGIKSHNKVPYVRLTIANSSERLLFRCQDILQRIIARPIKLNKKTVYEKAVVKTLNPGWTISVGSHNDLRKVLSLLQPYVVEKQEKLVNALTFLQLRKSDGYYYSQKTWEFLKSIGISPAETERGALYKEMKRQSDLHSNMQRQVEISCPA